jgi:hypothetical protein
VTLPIPKRVTYPTPINVIPIVQSGLIQEAELPITLSLPVVGEQILETGSTPNRADTNSSSSSTSSQFSKSSDTTLPVENPDNRDTIDTIENAGHKDRNEPQFSWLHVIILDKKFGKKQVPINIAKYKTDYEVFVKLNKEWRKHRGRWRALTCLKDIRLTKVKMAPYPICTV